MVLDSSVCYHLIGEESVEDLGYTIYFSWHVVDLLLLMVILPASRKKCEVCMAEKA